MIENDTNRLSRLTAILTQLQTTKLITATALAEKYQVSVRTIYRDIRSLEKSGVPVLTEEGRGYSLMEGYRVPPISFTESEANALITETDKFTPHKLTMIEYLEFLKNN
jgi:predicted DNA-binding transcriptional regulator YafY